ncbi:uncharacterized protein LOC141665037 [Apium graveolens]|uniref:uncharacterized protein LOC141665037 n=1 Tax=Apium graveolens TaxID=4045 RepID=UPI003D7AC6A5
MFVVESQGHSGGVAFLWRNKEDVVLKSYSKNHVDTIVHLNNSNHFRVTGVYGEPDRSKRYETWQLIRNLADNNNHPWILIGDMNNVCSQHDKKGGRPYPASLIQGFLEVLDECNMIDLDLQGYQYTWERGAGTSDWIEVRLDRALVTPDFMNMFKDAMLTNLEVSTSDHCPLLLEFYKAQQVILTRSFRFENAWMREPMCKQLVEDVWFRFQGRSFYEKIAECASVLTEWGKEITGSFKTRIHECKQKIKLLKGRRDDFSVECIKENQKKLAEAYAQQEAFWRQRSKQHWLKAGDQNSKFFHAAAKNRRSANRIKCLKNNEGQMVDWDSGLQDVMIDYFAKLFTATTTEWRYVIDCVQTKITENRNNLLLGDISEGEVKAALFHMFPDKSPGPDGMSPGFYQKHWQIVGGDIVNIVRQFFATGHVDQELQSTNIVLIPKKKSPSLMTELRPISLCNVVYKIISKVLANRLKSMIDGIISDEQSAFIPGRLITYNVMVAYEVMHFMKRKTTGKQAWMALKLDMSKAYDRVEWNFLEAVLNKMGFSNKVIQLFMACMSSVNYQINHAGRTFGSIIPSRGLRQGDPLSSYLFLICIEGFTSIIHDYENRNLIQGIKVARSAPSISHMFFADDCYIFCKASEDSANHILQMLNIFERASGQQINVEKSSVFYSRNTSFYLKQDIFQILKIKEAEENTHYLDLPNMLSRKKSAVFGYIKDRLQDRLQGWDKKCLSKGGKEILIKSTAQTLSNYAMSVFLLPAAVCKDLEMAMSKFWWKSDSSKDKGIHWMCWSRLTASKFKGGMGFKDLRDFNIALLGKQAWRLVVHPDKLVSRIFKARYYPSDSFLQAQLGSNPSYIWRSIMEAQSMVVQGISCRIGNGQEVDILNSPWLPSIDDPFVHSNNEALVNQKVAALFRIGEKAWDVDLVLDIFEARDADLILSIPLSENEKDTWYWRHEKMGQYSVKSGYKLLQTAKDQSNTADNSGFWRKLWNLKIPNKVKNFLWRASTNCLPTKDMLHSRRVQVNSQCPICNLSDESIIHALVTCTFANDCHQFSVVRQVTGVFHNFSEWLQLIFEQTNKNDMCIQITICWFLWKNRNDIVWKQRGIGVSEVVHTALSFLNQWKAVQDKNFDSFLSFLTPEDGQEQWCPPQLNSVKVNVDAALFEDPNRYSYVVVIRDHSGHLVHAMSKCLLGKISPELAEVLGIREALSWLKDTNTANGIVESDCLQVIQLIRSSFSSFSYLGGVVNDCRCLMEDLKDQNVKLHFVKRSANRVAHYLARYSCSIAERRWEVGNVHPAFYDMLCKDLHK